MNHKQDRATLLEQVGLYLPSKARGRKENNVRPNDYLAVPPPLNLTAHPIGNCLIWIWTLNPGGYGTSSFPGKEQLAHRQTFYQSRGKRPKLSVLHLCHRPYCIQPSHLYEGNQKENSDDRRLRVKDHMDLELAWVKSFIAEKAARYRWEDPAMIQKPLMKLEGKGEHQCKYIIPAGDRRICSICGNPDDPNLRVKFKEEKPEFQPPQNDRNIHEIVRHRRTFKDFGAGMVIKTDLAIDSNTPANRSEQRRREKEVRKNPIDRPIRLGPPVTLDPRDPKPINFQISGDQKIFGPGFLLLTMRQTVKPSPEQEKTRRINQKILNELSQPSQPNTSR